MANKHLYQIYALTQEEYTYVGKSFDSRPESVRWRHLRGDNKQTRAYFSREVADDLQFKVLTTVYCDSHEAYRYTIAYIRLFMEWGFTILNSDGMVEDACNLYPATERLLQSLKRNPLPEWLSGNRNTVTPDIRSSEPKNGKKRKSSKRTCATENLSLRLYPEEMAFFRACAKELGISLHSFFAILLDTYRMREAENPDWTCSDYVEIFLRSLRDRISSQEEEIQSLKEQIRQLKQEQAQSLKQREVLIRDGIRKYTEYFVPLHAELPHIPVGNYHYFLAEEADAKNYTYPQTEDFFIFCPTHIFYGHGSSAPRFIVGTNAAGDKTLLRFYPKTHYAGVYISNEKFNLVGSRWLVRAEKAADGAMDIIFSLPLDIALKERISKQEEFIHDVQTAIEEAIRRSESFF